MTIAFMAWASAQFYESIHNNKNNNSKSGKQHYVVFACTTSHVKTGTNFAPAIDCSNRAAVDPLIALP